MYQLLTYSFFQPLHLFSPSTSLNRFLQFGHSPQDSWNISASLMHSFPHKRPTWRPITLLDNARHKSSIGLSDTWGLSTRGTMLFFILFSSFSYLLSPSFVPSGFLFMNRFRALHVALHLCFAPFNLHICFSFSFVHSFHWFVFQSAQTLISTFLFLPLLLTLTFHQAYHLFLSSPLPVSLP